MNRIDRLTGTILLLQAHRGWTARRIAEHWEISERTVFRDLAALAEAGVPVVCDEQGGYRLMRGYHVPPVMFTEGEASALFVSGEIAEQLADCSLRDALRTALLKIRSVLPEERKEQLEGLRETLGVWIPTIQPDRSTDCLIPIQTAILQRHCLSLVYDTGGQGKLSERKVEPLGVLFYGDHWHMIAYCRMRKDFRDFRMDRVRSWTILGERFSGHDDFSVQRFLEEQFTCESLFPVVVTIETGSLERLKRGLFSLPEREESLNDGRVRIGFMAFSVEWLVDWLLGFGPSLKVESPDTLRLALREAALAIANNYHPSIKVRGH